MTQQPFSPQRPLETPRILIVGGGYVGLYAARRLQRRLRPGEATITLVDPEPNMTYQPFLAEAAAGLIEARHVVVPLRRALPHCQVVTGAVKEVATGRKEVCVTLPGGGEQLLRYDLLVLAPGSVSRTPPIPGLAERGLGFKTVGEAVKLRNHVLSRLDFAATTPDPEMRRRALTFVVVGGGYAGIEALAELEDMARAALRLYPNLALPDLRWHLVEATERVLPEVSAGLGRYTVRQLRKRGIGVHLDTVVGSLEGGHVVLSNGESFASDTVIWTAGVRANSLMQRVGLPLDRTGRLRCTPKLRVEGRADVYSAGDCAAVPDLTSRDPNALCGPSAQHAVRQAKRLADNLLASLRGRALKDYRHRNVGSVASLGLYKGVAEVYGVRLRGLPAWLLHRAYHLSLLPTVRQMGQVATDWALAGFFGRELLSLEQVQRPREVWEAEIGVSEGATVEGEKLEVVNRVQHV